MSIIPENIKEKVNRVFFHELGHFVAREINYLKYGGPLIVEICLYPCEQNPEEYCGCTTPFVPPGTDTTADVPIDRLPGVLASMIHGCLFQAYYTKTYLQDCFTIYGGKDEDSFDLTLNRQGLKNARSLFKEKMFSYYGMLARFKLLSDFININPEKFLLPKANGRFDVDMSLLRAELKKEIENYISYYDSLIEAYSAIIQSTLSQEESYS